MIPRTPQDFKNALLKDAYNHMLARLASDAWADGYEAARRDLQSAPGDHADAIDVLYRASHSDLANRFVRAAAEGHSARDAEAIMAMAILGKAISP